MRIVFKIVFIFQALIFNSLSLEAKFPNIFKSNIDPAIKSCTNKLRRNAKTARISYQKEKIEEICKCEKKIESIYSNNSSLETWQGAQFCILMHGRPLNKVGIVSLQENFADYSVGVYYESIRKMNLNGSSKRYFGWKTAMEQLIPGREGYIERGNPGYYVPGQAGTLNCYTGPTFPGYAMNHSTTTCSESGGTDGYYVPATKDRYISPIPDRIEIVVEDITIDCKDKTFDIKNDGKNWSRIENTSDISTIEKLICPFIDFI